MESIPAGSSRGNEWGAADSHRYGARLAVPRAHEHDRRTVGGRSLGRSDYRGIRHRHWLVPSRHSSQSSHPRVQASPSRVLRRLNPLRPARGSIAVARVADTRSLARIPRSLFRLRLRLAFNIRSLPRVRYGMQTCVVGMNLIPTGSAKVVLRGVTRAWPPICRPCPTPCHSIGTRPDPFATVIHDFATHCGHHLAQRAA